MTNISYHKCHYCRKRARESVLAMDLKLPDGTPWVMYACSDHYKDLCRDSDELLGVNNGVSRLYCSTTDGFDKSESAQSRIDAFRKNAEEFEAFKQTPEYEQLMRPLASNRREECAGENVGL